MKYYAAGLMVCVASFMTMSETVSKLSKPFTLPTTGVVSRAVYRNAGTSLSYGSSALQKRSVAISWALSDKKIDGTLSIYTLSGSLVTKFAVSNPKGEVVWNRKGSNVRSGVYLAVLSAGSFKQSIRMIL